jgi:hypothetical protein
MSRVLSFSFAESGRHLTATWNTRVMHQVKSNVMFLLRLSSTWHEVKSRNKSTLHAYQTLDRDSADIYLQGGCLFGFRRSNTPHHHLTHTLPTPRPPQTVKSSLARQVLRKQNSQDSLLLTLSAKRGIHDCSGRSCRIWWWKVVEEIWNSSRFASSVVISHSCKYTSSPRGSLLGRKQLATDNLHNASEQCYKEIVRFRKSWYNLRLQNLSPCSRQLTNRHARTIHRCWTKKPV